VKLIHRKCGHPLVFDHIENKWFCFKCNNYPDPDDIILAKSLMEEASEE